MTQARVTLTIDKSIATVTFDHPPVNAWSKPMTDGLREVLRELRSDDAIEALILTGAGERAFSAGSDIAEMSNLLSPGQAVERKLRPQHEVFSELAHFPKPTIAALNGLTLGGGVEIACCCDFVVAEEQVQLGSPEVKLGVFPSSGGTFRITRRIGEGRAKQFMLLGEPIVAQTALEWGLVSHVVPRGQALSAAEELAATLVTRGLTGYEMCKSVILEALALPEPELVEFSLAQSEKAFTSDEAREGVSAFLEKRTPDFKSSRVARSERGSDIA